MATEQTFSLHDVGAVLDGVETDDPPSVLKSALLFHSTPHSQASREQNRYMREEARITTVLDMNPNFKMDSHVVTRALGVTHCCVQLRNDMFAQDLLNEQPPRKIASFMSRSNSAGPETRAELVKDASEMAMKRTVVDEGIAILKAASKSATLKYIFNDILARNNEAFPLLVSGDVKARSSLIILFLLLLMLGFNEGAIKQVILQFEGTDDSTGAFIEHLKKRLDAEYGSKEHFFRQAEVTEQAENTIREKVLVSATKEKIESLLD